MINLDLHLYHTYRDVTDMTDEQLIFEVKENKYLNDFMHGVGSFNGLMNRIDNLYLNTPEQYLELKQAYENGELL